MRIHYLQSIKKFREESRTVVGPISGWTYIHSSHTLPYRWNDQIQSGGYAVPVAEGQRFIIVHAGNQYGFIPNALLIFESIQKTGEYRHQYRYWIEEKLVHNLPANSVLVIDKNYHKAQLGKTFIYNATKSNCKSG